MTEEDVFSEKNEVASNWAKFNEPNVDKIYGTLVSKLQRKSIQKEKLGQLEWVYEIKADYGTFHGCDAKKNALPDAMTVNAGDYWNIGGKYGLDVQMKNVAVGTKVGIKYLGEKENADKMKNPTKILKVFIPKNDEKTGPLMDQEWLDAQVPGSET